MGSIQSSALQFVLANPPAKPTPAPAADPAGTTTSTIEVILVNENPDTGGSPITLYELQMDDGESGDFETILTSPHATSAVVDTGLVRGRYYRFRYRVRNVVGFSEYSDVSYIQAVERPVRPQPPQFVSATDESITIHIVESTDPRGVDIESYEIWVDEGDDLTSDFRQVTGGGYDGVSPFYTLQTDLDTLGPPGTVYRLKVRAKNEDDVYSEFSDPLVVALGSVPAAPSTPVKDIGASGAEEIAVDWDPLIGGTLPIYGYRLYSDLGSDDEFSLVFDG